MLPSESISIVVSTVTAPTRMSPAAATSTAPAVASIFCRMISPRPRNSTLPASEIAITSAPAASSNFSPPSTKEPAATEPPIWPLAVNVISPLAVKSAVKSSCKSLMLPPASISIVVSTATAPTRMSPAAARSTAPAVASIFCKTRSPRPRNSTLLASEIATTSESAASSNFSPPSKKEPKATEPPIWPLATNVISPSAVKSTAKSSSRSLMLPAVVLISMSPSPKEASVATTAPTKTFPVVETCTDPSKASIDDNSRSPVP